MEDKKIADGTEVLIFKYIRERGLQQDNFHFKRGIIQSSKLTEDLSTHGSIWQKHFYTVLGEDGQLYFGTYGSGSVGGSFFRTPHDHMAYLANLICRNDKKIEELEGETEKYQDMMATLYAEEMARPKKQEEKPIEKQRAR